MSRDGYLPPGVESYMIPGNRPEDDHHESCPCHEDQPEVYGGCGGKGSCTCAVGDIDDCCPVEPECICADLEEEGREARAEGL